MSISTNSRSITAIALARVKRLFGLKAMTVEEAVKKGQVIKRNYRDIDINWLITNPEDEIQCAQIRDIFYERRELQQVLSQLDRADVILDIGTNIGNHAIFFERMYRPRIVILVEPQPLAIKHLLANIALNYSPAYDLSYLGVAVSGTRAMATVSDPTRFNIGLSRVVEDEKGNVPLVTGDEIVQGRNIDLIKIDVEGMEYRVLEGLQKTLETSNALLLIEVCDQERDRLHRFLANLSYFIVFESEMYQGMKNCIFKRRG